MKTVSEEFIVSFKSKDPIFNGVIKQDSHPGKKEAEEFYNQLKEAGYENLGLIRRFVVEDKLR